jgi:phage-related protein
VAFDAGTIVAHLDLDDAEFDRKLRAARARGEAAGREKHDPGLGLEDGEFKTKLDADVAKIERLEHEPHEVKITERFDESGMSRARMAFQRLDRDITTDSNRRGGIFAALGGLFSGHFNQSNFASFGRSLVRNLSTSSGATGAGGILSAAGPGMGFLSPKAALIGAAVPVGMAALPALGGVLGTGLGGTVGLGGAALLGGQAISQNLGPALQAYQQAQQAMQMAVTPQQRLAAQRQMQGAQQFAAKAPPGGQAVFRSITGLQDAWQSFTGSLLPMLARPLRQIVPMVESLFGPLRKFFADSMTVVTPFVRALTTGVRAILPLLGDLAKASGPGFAMLTTGLLKLVQNILPGLTTLVKATAPYMKEFAGTLSGLGASLGKMFAVMAPAVGPSMRVLDALLRLVGSLLPVIGKLSAIFARALAPVIIAFGKALQILEPSLIIIGRLLASLAGAVLNDLMSVLIAVARLIADAAPALTILAKAFGQVFNALESAGVFGAFTSALEQLAPLIAQIINQLVSQLMPILPALIGIFVRFTSVLITLTTAGLATLLRGLSWLLDHMPWVVPLVGALAAAWVALNLVLAVTPLGWIVIGIVAVVGAITLLATHWHRAWTDIKNWAEDAWHFLTSGWGQWLFPGLYLIRKVVEFVRDHWHQAWDDIKGAASDAWHFIYNNVVSPIDRVFTKDIPHYFDVCVSAVKTGWKDIQDAVKTPVAWVIDHVVNGLIHAFDWVSSKVGGPHIGDVHPFGLQKGGRLPGWGGGDILPALLEPGETVVSKEHSTKLADVFNAIGVPGYQAGGRVRPGTGGIGQQAIGTGNRLAAGGQHNIFSDIWHKGGDIAKAVTAVATGNSTALRNALVDLFPHGVHGAVGTLATDLVDIPARLLSYAIKELIGFGGGGLGGRGADIARYAMTFAGKIPYVWGGTSLSGCDCSGFTGAIYHHFGIHAPRTSEAQGAWVTRGAPQTGGLAFYNSPAGGPPPGHVAIVGFHGNVISQGGGMGPQIQPLRSMPFMFAGIPPGTGSGPRGAWTMAGLPGLWDRAGGPSSQAHIAAAIAMAESGGDPRAHNASGATGLWQILGQVYPGNLFDPYINARNAVRKYYQAGGFSPWVTYTSGAYRNFMDSGGWLMPGVTVNATGKPEAVLNPRQSRAFVDLADAAHKLQKGGGGLMRDIYLMLPEGTTVAQALAEVSWRLRTAANAGYSGVPGG